MQEWAFTLRRLRHLSERASTFLLSTSKSVLERQRRYTDTCVQIWDDDLESKYPVILLIMHFRNAKKGVFHSFI